MRRAGAHRSTLHLGLIVTVILLLAACGAGTAGTPSPSLENGSSQAPTSSDSASGENPLSGDGEVVVFSYGGSWTENQRSAINEPFVDETGIEVVDVTGDFSEATIRAMFEAGAMEWDFAEIQASLYPTMSEEGMFEEIDYSLWDPADLEAIPEELRRTDAVGGACTGQLLAYDTRAYGDATPPSTWAEFWDVEAFPGPRGLFAAAAKHNLVIALVADGVDSDDIWPLTSEKVDRALAKLDEIRPHITKWWTSGGEPPQLVANGELQITSMYTGRAIAGMDQGIPLGIDYSGAPINCNWWAIPKGAPNLENAQKFIAYINQAENAARFSEAIGYPLANSAMYEYISDDVAALFPTSPQNRDEIVLEDSAWLAEVDPATGLPNVEVLNQRWLQWKADAGIEE